MMAAETWTIKRCLDWTRDYLRDKGDEHPRLTAEWMLSAVTGLDRVGLYTNFDRPLAPEELDRMHDYVVRRAKGEPIQYITGETQFRTLSILCAPGVLIPRPETELLVEEVLEYLDREVLKGLVWGAAAPRATLPWNAEVEEARRREEAEAAKRAAEQGEGDGGAAGNEAASTPGEGASGEDAQSDAQAGDDAQGAAADAVADASATPSGRLARVFEVGCGTGCISLSLVSERAGLVSCVATDIDEGAVSLAMQNRERSGVSADEVDIRKGDLTKPIRPEERRTFDVLVSNPPYVPSAVVDGLPREVVGFEPRLALDGGADGLDVFRRLVMSAHTVLRPGGLLACELFEDSLDAAAELCREASMEDVRIMNDLAGRPRIVLARLA